MRGAPILLLFLFGNPSMAAEKPAVVELFEDDVAGLVPQLTNNGGDSVGVPADPDEKDLFAGARSLRVVPMQRYGDRIKDWSFRVVEKPEAGQYRYVRFAWKKTGGNSMMVQFHGSDPISWEHRYFAGSAPPQWASIKIGEAVPDEWVLVTRDLWKDFGNLTVTGMAFTPTDGTYGHFDHVLLGRSIADLDSATAAAMKKTKPLGLREADLVQLWERLADAETDAFIWKLIREGDAAGRVIKQSVLNWKVPRLTEPDAKEIEKLIGELKHYRFTVREQAQRELMKYGAAAARFVDEAQKAEKDPIVQARLLSALKKLEVSDPRAAERRRLLAAVRVLGYLGSADAKEALEHLSRKPFQEMGVAGAAITALEQWKTSPRMK